VPLLVKIQPDFAMVENVKNGAGLLVAGAAGFFGVKPAVLVRLTVDVVRGGEDCESTS
jgi:hypothetical protein